ncbi:hypothetical protein [Vibrio alginolyticus]|uniref:hypothetical protein n=1 Tax=Vibrio alginolyticus TaxID=663 RepID=UPI00355001C1
MATVAALPFPQLPEFFSFFATNPYGIVISLLLGLIISGVVLMSVDNKDRNSDDKVRHFYIKD